MFVEEVGDGEDEVWLALLEGDARETAALLGGSVHRNDEFRMILTQADEVR